jgi:hypothetical protein
MDYSCPKKSLESLEEAEMPFEEGTFLTEKLERTSDGILTEAQFDKLFQRAKGQGKYIDFNSYSFETLTDSIQREFCYALQRYIFYIAAYQDSIKQKKKNTTFLTKAKEFNQKLQDLITCYQFMDQRAIEGKQAPLVERTNIQDPYALQALTGRESFRDYRVELQEQMTDIDAELKLRQDKVLFTKEKNTFAMTQLSLYTFANLAAVGLLLYFFRSKT